MRTTIPPHAILSPDHSLVVIVDFSAVDSANSDWPERVTDVVFLHTEMLRLGGFRERCWPLDWRVTMHATSFEITYERLPGDPSVLPVLARMLLALPLPPAVIHVRGTAAGMGSRALPSTASALGLLPRTRLPCAFALEIEPGAHGLCLDVSCAAGLDPAAAQLIDERVSLWCDLGRAGGLSEISHDGGIAPGDIGKAEPAISIDSYSTELMFDGLDLAAPAVLVNMLDDLARTHTKIDHISIL